MLVKVSEGKDNTHYLVLVSRLLILGCMTTCK